MPPLHVCVRRAGLDKKDVKTISHVAETAPQTAEALQALCDILMVKGEGERCRLQLTAPFVSRLDPDVPVGFPAEATYAEEKHSTFRALSLDGETG